MGYFTITWAVTVGLCASFCFLISGASLTSLWLGYTTPLPIAGAVSGALGILTYTVWLLLFYKQFRGDRVPDDAAQVEMIEEV